MKNWGTGYFITVGLGTLVLSLIFGPNILVQVHFFLQALFFIALFAMTKPKLHKNLVSQLYLLICILGMLVGGYHVLNDNNEVFHYVKYSTIYLTGFLALQIGFSHANKFDTNLIKCVQIFP